MGPDREEGSYPSCVAVCLIALAFVMVTVNVPVLESEFFFAYVLVHIFFLNVEFAMSSPVLGSLRVPSGSVEAFRRAPEMHSIGSTR